MKQSFTLLFLLFFFSAAHSQQSEFQKRFTDFNLSRGDAETGQKLTLSYEETVLLHSNLNSNSGLGPTFNYYGTVVVVDQMDILPNGDVQMVLRREDGKDFYGLQPTLKAVLSKKSKTVLNTTQSE